MYGWVLLLYHEASCSMQDACSFVCSFVFVALVFVPVSPALGAIGRVDKDAGRKGELHFVLRYYTMGRQVLPPSMAGRK